MAVHATLVHIVLLIFTYMINIRTLWNANGQLGVQADTYILEEVWIPVRICVSRVYGVQYVDGFP